VLKAKVVSVAESSGVRQVELAWECGIAADPCEPWSKVAVRAAERWYEDTDQCSECHLVMRIINAAGEFTDFAVACAPVVAVSARERESGDGCVGRVEPIPQTRDDGLAAAVKLIALRCAGAARGDMEYTLDRAARELFEVVRAECAA
jgi:hypothetical protein